MNAQALLQILAAQSKGILDAAMAGIDDTTLHYDAPGGTINSSAAIYVHAVRGVDGMVNGFAQQKPTVFQAGGWAAKTGLPEAESPMQARDQAGATRINMMVMQEYENAVFASADAYLASASDAEMARMVTPPFGGDAMPLAAFLALIFGVHTNGHMGEIAALKGVQGKQGLPF
jgi:hypothetical protein